MAHHDDRDDGSSKPGEKGGDVRKRVTRHLRKLLIPGVLGLGACKSSDPGVVCDPMPPPATTDTTGPAGNQDAAPPPDTSADRPVPPPVVCDPMPAPTPKPPKK